jgi:hypothetical protein
LTFKLGIPLEEHCRQMMTRTKIKNGFLLLTFVLSQVPQLFYSSTERLNLSIFIERSTRIDFFVMYYVIAIDFLIMAYCLHYPKGISRRVTRLILIVTSLDLIHLITLAKQKFGFAKIGVALLILLLCEIYLKRKKWLQ